MITMTTIPIMHLVNNLSDSSISRIALDIIRHAPPYGYSWYVGTLSGDGPMSLAFSDAGAVLVDYSSSSTTTCLRTDLQNLNIKILHSHSPRTTLSGWKAVSRIPAQIRPKHATTKHLLTGIKDRRWGLIYSLVDYLSLYLPNHLLPVSKTMQNKILRLPFMSSSRVTAIPNGIPCELYGNNSLRPKAREELGLSSSSYCFGYAGRLDPVKRIDILLASFQSVLRKHPGTRLLILGDGQLKRDLQKMAEELGIDRSVIWAGFRRDMPAMLSAMDAYLQPSANEGLSLSILEAMAAHRPVVATRVGAAEEVLVHRKTGLLVETGSIDQLIESMLFLMENPEAGFSLAQEAYDHVLANYSTRRMASDYLNVYQKLLSGGHDA